jgi:hypothetical protein
VSVADKRRVLAAVIERIRVNEGVRGRAVIGNRPEDRAVIAWRSDEPASGPDPIHVTSPARSTAGD